MSSHSISSSSSSTSSSSSASSSRSSSTESVLSPVDSITTVALAALPSPIAAPVVSAEPVGSQPVIDDENPYVASVSATSLYGAGVVVNNAISYVSPWLASAASYLVPIKKAADSAGGYVKTAYNATTNTAANIASSVASTVSDKYNSGVELAGGMLASTAMYYLSVVGEQDKKFLSDLTETNELTAWIEAITLFLPDKLKTSEKQHIGYHLFASLVKAEFAEEIKLNQKISTPLLLERIISSLSNSVIQVFKDIEQESTERSMFATKAMFEPHAKAMIKKWLAPDARIPFVTGVATGYLTDFLYDTYVAQKSPSQRPHFADSQNEVIKATESLVENQIQLLQTTFLSENAKKRAPEQLFKEIIKDHIFKNSPSFSKISDETISNLFGLFKTALPFLGTLQDNLVEVLLRRISLLSKACGSQDSSFDEQLATFVMAFKNSDRPQEEILADFLLADIENERRIPKCLREPLSKFLRELFVLPENKAKIFDKIKPWIDLLIADQNLVENDPLAEFGIDQEAIQFVEQFVEDHFESVKESLPDDMKGIIQPKLGKFVAKRALMHCLRNYASSKKVEKENFNEFLKMLVDEALYSLNECFVNASEASDNKRDIHYIALTSTFIRKFAPSIAGLGSLFEKHCIDGLEYVWNVTMPYDQAPYILKISELVGDEGGIVASFCDTLEALIEERFYKSFVTSVYDKESQDLKESLTVTDEVSLVLSIPDKLVLRLKDCIKDTALKSLVSFLDNEDLSEHRGRGSLIQAFLKNKIPELLEVLPLREMAEDFKKDPTLLTQKLSKPKRWVAFSEILLKELPEDIPLRSLIIKTIMPKVLAQHGLLIWESVNALDLDLTALNTPLDENLRMETEFLAAQIAKLVKENMPEPEPVPVLEKKGLERVGSRISVKVPVVQKKNFAYFKTDFAEASISYLIQHHIAKYVVATGSYYESLSDLLADMVQQLIAEPMSIDGRCESVAEKLVDTLFPGLESLKPLLVHLITPYTEALFEDNINEEKQNLRKLLWDKNIHQPLHPTLHLPDVIEEHVSKTVCFETIITHFETLSENLSSLIMEQVKKELKPRSIDDLAEESDSESISSSSASSSSSSVASYESDEPTLTLETLFKKVAGSLLHTDSREMKLGEAKLKIALQKLILQAVSHLITKAKANKNDINPTQIVGEIINEAVRLFKEHAPDSSMGSTPEAWVEFSIHLKNWLFPEETSKFPLPNKERDQLIKYLTKDLLPKVFAEFHEATYSFINKTEENKEGLDSLLKSNYASLFADVLTKTWLNDFIARILKEENQKVAALATSSLNDKLGLQLGVSETKWVSETILQTLVPYRDHLDVIGGQKSEITHLFDWLGSYNEALLVHFLRNFFSSIDKKDRDLRKADQGTYLTYVVELLVPLIGMFFNVLKGIKKDSGAKHVSNISKESLIAQLKEKYEALSLDTENKTKPFQEEFCLDEGDLDDQRIDYFLTQSALLLKETGLEIDKMPAPAFLKGVVFEFLQKDAIARLFALSDRLILENTNDMLLYVFTKMRTAIKGMHIDEKNEPRELVFTNPADKARRDKFDSSLKEIVNGIVAALPNLQAMPMILEIERIKRLTGPQLGEILRNAMVDVNIFEVMAKQFKDLIALLVVGNGNVVLNRNGNIAIEPAEGDTELRGRFNDETPKAKEKKAKKVLEDLKHNGQEAFMEGLEEGVFMSFILRWKKKLEAPLINYFNNLEDGTFYKKTLRILGKIYNFFIDKIAVPIIYVVFYIPYQLIVRIPAKLYFRHLINNYVKELQSPYHEANYLRTLSELFDELIRECNAFRSRAKKD